MKIIDDKGRIGGKINIIDLLAIILVLAVLAALGLRFLGKQANRGETGDQVGIQYTVLCRSVNKQLLPGFEAELGKQLMAGGEMVEGCYLTDMEVLPFYSYYASNKTDSGYVKVESEEYVDIVFTVSGTAPYSGNSCHVGTQEVRIGKSHIVKTVGMETTGTTLTLEVTND